MEIVLFRSFVSRQKKLRTSPHSRVVLEEVEGYGPTEYPNLLFTNQMVSILEDSSASEKRPIIRLSLEQSVSNKGKVLENLRNCQIQMAFIVDKPLEVRQSKPDSGSEGEESPRMVISNFVNPRLKLTVVDCQSGTVLLSLDRTNFTIAKIVNEADFKESMLYLLDTETSFEFRTLGLSQYELKTSKSNQQLVFDGTVHTLWAIIEQEIFIIKNLLEANSGSGRLVHDIHANRRVDILRQRLTYWFSQEYDCDRELLRLQQEKRRLGSVELNKQEAELVSQKFAFKESLFAAIVELFPSIKTHSVKNDPSEFTIGKYIDLIGSYSVKPELFLTHKSTKSLFWDWSNIVGVYLYHNPYTVDVKVE